MKRSGHVQDDFEMIDDFDDDYFLDGDEYEDEHDDEYDDELVRMRRRNQYNRAEKRSQLEPFPVRSEGRQTGNKRSSASKAASGNASGTQGAKASARKPAAQTAHKRRDDRLKKKKQRKRARGFLAVLLVIICLITAFSYISFRQKMKDGYWTVAVFGVDSRDGKLKEGNHSDVEMVASLNWETGEIRLVSVYRDTYMQIDSKGNYHKINQAYFEGGPEQAVDALERNLDLKIDNYVTFNWKAVIDAINILGGIDMDITDREFEYINSFITETVESTGVGSVHLEHAGSNHLDGVQAVAYSRLRLMDTDFNRTERQRKVISLAMDKAKQADFAALNNIIVTVLPQTSTDIGVDDLIPLAKNISKYSLGQTGGFPFAKGTKKIAKRDCVVPQTLETNVIQLHQFLYDDLEYVPSAEVKKISSKISEDSGMYEEGKSSGADKPSGNSGGGNSGNNNSGNSGTQPQTAAPAETQPQETEPVTEETSETLENAESDASEEASEETASSEGEASEDADKETLEESPEKSTEETIEETEASVGPGENLRPSEPNAGPGGGNENTEGADDAKAETTETSGIIYANP